MRLLSGEQGRLVALTQPPEAANRGAVEHLFAPADPARMTVRLPRESSSRRAGRGGSESHKYR
jgi:hypothetical protein